VKLNPSLQNNNSQPRPEFKIFNRWDVVAKGWYQAGPSRDLKKSEAKGIDISGQHIVIYRGESGQVYALDGFCPHMGVDLGIGSVEKESIRCFFHHWKFDQKGQCTDIPCLKKVDSKIKNLNYKVQEKYGMIWVYPEAEAPYGVLEIPELEGFDLNFSTDKTYKRSCHYHITMINGIDPQHLSTVHNIHMDMKVDIEAREKDSVNISLQGKTPDKKISEKLVKLLLGDHYAYSMKYQSACLAGLTVLKGVKLFGKWEVIPTLHMLFSYQSHIEGETLVTPIYLTKKRNFFIDWILLKLTKMSFLFLQGEDGEVYENIRFSTSNLLAIDAPVSKYIKYVNSLSPSLWSRTKVLEKPLKTLDRSEVNE
jgi:phenylpropionate dioxygenase-like ring-hydroxylating dioxygenase large terminal subunit